MLLPGGCVTAIVAAEDAPAGAEVLADPVVELGVEGVEPAAAGAAGADPVVVGAADVEPPGEDAVEERLAPPAAGTVVPAGPPVVGGRLPNEVATSEEDK